MASEQSTVGGQAIPGPFTAPVPEPGRRRIWLRVLIVTAVVLAVLAAASVVVYVRVFDVYVIPSAAMAPTLDVGDRVMVRGIAGDEVHRGDVVIVETESELPAGQGPQVTVKRVIAVAGEQIVAVDGEVRIDGEPLDEPYLERGIETEGLRFQQVPEGHLFLMGDNRPNSHDSRNDGPVPNDAVIGLAVSTWPPPGDGF